MKFLYELQLLIVLSRLQPPSPNIFLKKISKMLVRLKSEIFLFSLLVLDSLKGSETTCMKYVWYMKLCLTLFMMRLLRAVHEWGQKAPPTPPRPPTPMRKMFYT